uniref:AB hydrolase-1 domain-containing protein n=1 Tax=Trichogramma kaykai TaxID=54128 RepID=A0ABD2W8F1_9HYME
MKKFVAVRSIHGLTLASLADTGVAAWLVGSFWRAHAQLPQPLAPLVNKILYQANSVLSLIKPDLSYALTLANDQFRQQQEQQLMITDGQELQQRSSNEIAIVDDEPSHDLHDEIHFSTPELITKHGYIAETHHAWTEDGYRLELHRVVRKAKYEDVNDDLNAKKEQKVKIPILINHGLLSSSADWVLLGPRKALAYLLCDCGYDVWLANVRGNTYSQCHKQYTTKDREFWNFSWHEIGVYDIPAMIDYILEKTQQTSLHYIGYSQGTSTFFVMSSERPEYVKKIKSLVNLAPIAFISNHKSPLLKLVTRLYVIMEWGSMYCNIHEWFPRNKLQAKALRTLIRNTPGTVTKSLYSCWFCLIAGFGSNQLDKSMLPLIFSHFPGGSSAKQIIHYSQTILTDSFRKFDHGTAINLKLYGSTRPPKYSFERATCPTAVFYSENDCLTQPADIQRLVDLLPNIQLKHKIEYSKFNHIDYLWGRDAKFYLYDHIINFIKKYD